MKHGKSLREIVFAYSNEINEGTDLFEKLAFLTSELGELTDEMLIAEGNSLKEPGVDGIVGEAIDCILCLLDIIKYEEPEITDEELAEIMVKKCDKWRDNVQKKHPWLFDIPALDK